LCLARVEHVVWDANGESITNETRAYDVSIRAWPLKIAALSLFKDVERMNCCAV